MMTWKDYLEAIDPLINRIRIFIYPLFISAYIAELKLGSITGWFASPLALYASRVIEGIAILTILYSTIGFFHKLILQFKIFGQRLQFKGVVGVFLMPYGILGLVGGHFEFNSFGNPSLWHFTALGLGYVLLDEVRQENRNIDIALGKGI